MSEQTTALRLRSSVSWAAVIAFVLALLLPMISTNRVSAAQLNDRRIDMQSSAVSTETTYEIDFELPSTAAVGAFRIEFCDEDPIPGAACNSTTTEGTTVPSLDADTGSAITISNFALGASLGSTTNNADECTAPTLDTSHGAGSNLNYFDVVCNAQEATVTGGGDEEFVHIT